MVYIGAPYILQTPMGLQVSHSNQQLPEYKPSLGTLSEILTTIRVYWVFEFGIPWVQVPSYRGIKQLWIWYLGPNSSSTSLIVVECFSWGAFDLVLRCSAEVAAAQASSVW